MKKIKYSIIETIKNKTEDFTAVEKKIGIYILKNTDSLIGLTSKKFSEYADVSEAGVIRFCKGLGIKNFKTLQLMLIREIAMNEDDVNSIHWLEEKKNETPQNIINRIAKINKLALDDMLCNLNEDSFNKATTTLKNADKIIFFGVGASYPIAYDFYSKFLKLGIEAYVSTDSHIMSSLILNLKKGQIFFAVSTSGRTPEVIELAKIAKKTEGTVIALTQSSKSPLHSLCDILLDFPVLEADDRITTVTSQTIELTIINGLFLSVCNKYGKSAIDKIDKVRKEAKGKLIK